MSVASIKQRTTSSSVGVAASAIVEKEEEGVHLKRREGGGGGPQDQPLLDAALEVSTGDGEGRVEGKWTCLTGPVLQHSNSSKATSKARGDMGQGREKDCPGTSCSVFPPHLARRLSAGGRDWASNKGPHRPHKNAGSTRLVSCVVCKMRAVSVRYIYIVLEFS